MAPWEPAAPQTSQRADQVAFGHPLRPMQPTFAVTPVGWGRF